MVRLNAGFIPIELAPQYGLWQLCYSSCVNDSSGQDEQLPPPLKHLIFLFLTLCWTTLCTSTPAIKGL